MIHKSEIKNALKKAGVEATDETPGKRGSWAFTIAGMHSGYYPGEIEAVVAGLKCVEELTRLLKHFNQHKPDLSA
uniref:Uncharacterized protein n=1 Tax=candidate division WOR-3 bacterium TaxID=2052148 RepID=A0A7C6EBG8_UNCW3